VFRRSAVIGLLAGLSVLATLAGCVRVPPGFETPKPVEESIAPKMISEVLRQRTATVKVGLQIGGSGGRAELSGPVEYTADGVNADLTGTIAGNAVHLVVLDDTVYVSGLFQLAPGTTWLKMKAGGDRASNSSYWLNIDEIVTGLTYVTDEAVLAGLAYNAAPSETLDGITVRTAVAQATRADMVGRLPPAQLARYEQSLDFTGARIMVGVGEDALPRRFVVTPTGTGYYPTMELDHSGWATTKIAITVPSGPEVRDYP